MHTEPPNALPRVLGPWTATAIVVGTVIGTGVFVKGRNVADNVPDFATVVAVWVLGGVLALLGSLALAEIAVLFPKAGGNYVFLREGYGRGAGFLWGWVEFWIIRAASAAALVTMFTNSFHDVLRQSLYPDQKNVEVLSFWMRQVMSVSVLVGLTAVSIRGTFLGGAVQFAITVLKVASLLFLIVLPFVVYAYAAYLSGDTPKAPPKIANLQPVWPANGINWSGFGAALIGVLWAYNGWMNLAPVAGEVKNPQRNIPLALLAAVAVLITLYCGANLAYHLVLPREAIVAKPDGKNLSSTPLATEFASVLLGPVGVILASAIVMTSVLGALNGNILVGPRLLFAMGQDRLAPSKLAELHPRYKTPALAIAVMTTWACLLVVCVGALTQYRLPTIPTPVGELDFNVPEGKSPFDIMTDFVIFGSVTLETLAVTTIFVFRRRIPVTPANRPYKCWGYPLVPALYVAIMGVVLVMFFVNPGSRSEAFVGMGFIASGALAYALFFRNRRA